MADNAYFNGRERIECSGVEFTSGDVVIVFLDDVWRETRIEHNGREYYSTDGYQLVGNPVKKKPFDPYSSKTGEVIPLGIRRVVDVLNFYIKELGRDPTYVSREKAYGIVEGLRLTYQIDTMQSDFIRSKIEKLEAFDVSEFY